MSTEKYTLPIQRSIAPLYKLLINIGGLLPLTGPSAPIRKLFYIRYVFITLVGFGLLSVYGFGSYILTEQLLQNKSIQQIVLTVANYLFYPLAIATLVAFTKNRVSICNFLQEWRQLEERLDLELSNLGASSKRYWLVSIIACCYCVGGTAFLVYFCVAYAEVFPSFASDFNVPGSFGFYICIFVEASINFYTVCLSSFGEIMSAYTYRHLAFLFSKIEKAFLVDLRAIAESVNMGIAEDRSLSCDERQQGNVELKTISYEDAVNKLWDRTEYVNRLVAQAQTLFGFVLYISYATSFLVGCFGGYFILVTLQCQNLSKDSLPQRCQNQTDVFPSSPEILIVNVVGQIIAVYKLIIITKLCTSLPKQLTESQAVMSNALHYQWKDLKTDDKLMCWNYLQHLRLKNWTASPLELFKISDSTLLSMYSLVATYVIVLLQTECRETQK